MKNKLYLLVSFLSLVLMILVACSSQKMKQKSETNKIIYVEESQEKEVTKDKKELTPDETARKEGISAEQIVIKITDDGYVTSHGDHYHYYNGNIPYNSLISEELLLTDTTYDFKAEDVIYDVENGYIIKNNDQYFLYLPNSEERSHVRTKEQIVEQQEQ